MVGWSTPAVDAEIAGTHAVGAGTVHHVALSPAAGERICQRTGRPGDMADVAGKFSWQHCRAVQRTSAACRPP
jgi:hypothetical protein